MSDERQPSTPPAIDGFEPIRLIGIGGYADVFLYQQLMPRQEVAVKVLLPDTVSVTQLSNEANLMAKVSGHPYIVDVASAGVSADGRPYFVMKYYAGANLLVRAGSEHFSAPAVLKLGVQLAGAIETAHRSGIMHRDIKPANVLSSSYGEPGLTDFGIADAGDGSDDGVDGVSVPWAPPEAFRAGDLDARSDIYSLAATLYHVLAGRSPFEVLGAENTDVELISRICRDPVPPIGRSDVPTSFERLLSTSMSKSPEHRPSSAAEFARGLQAVEAELRVTQTPLPLPDLGVVGTARPAGGDRTRVRGVTHISPDQPASPPATEGRSSGGATPHRHTKVRGDLIEDVAESESEPEASKPNRWLIAGAVAGVIAAIGIAVLVFGGGDSETATTTTVFSVNEALTESSFLEPVSDLQAASLDGEVVFEWEAPEAVDGDQFVYSISIDGRSETGRTSATSVNVPAVDGVEHCIRVIVTRSGFADSASSRVCVTP